MARRIRRPLGPLDQRAQAILRAVIEEYVTTATPVGSQVLVEKYKLPVSSATVRNILTNQVYAGHARYNYRQPGVPKYRKKDEAQLRSLTTGRRYGGMSATTCRTPRLTRSSGLSTPCWPSSPP